MIEMMNAHRNKPFDAYIEWAQGQGCTVKEEHLASEIEQTLKLVTLTMPNGKWVKEVTSPDDYLISTTVARLDRRLGIKSRFF